MGVGGDYKIGQAVDDFDITYYMGFSSDASWGIVVAVDVEPESNGTWILDLGTEIGKATVASCTSSDLVKALELIDQYGEPMD